MGTGKGTALTGLGGKVEREKGRESREWGEWGEITPREMPDAGAGW